MDIREIARRQGLPPGALAAEKAARKAARTAKLFARLRGPADWPRVDRLYSTGETSLITGYHLGTIVSWCKAGRIPFEKVGPRYKLSLATVELLCARGAPPLVPTKSPAGDGPSVG